MEKIALAKHVKYAASEEPNRGRIEIEPLFPGYGITLGNSIRRVLLSSLPGASAVGVKIKGASHEFMALPHVKEDVLELILNIKQLRLKLHTDMPVRLSLDAHGKKVVTAGDISPNSDAEVINPDLRLCEITDMAGNLNLEILATTGMGYETIESREEERKRSKEIGFIEIDSIFTPVIHAGLSVENVRVGKMTNYDKLIIDLETDGSISPEQAYEESVRILIEQFSAVASLEGQEAAAGEEASGEEGQEAAAGEEASGEEGEEDGGKSKKKRSKPKK